MKSSELVARRLLWLVLMLAFVFGIFAAYNWLDVDELRQGAEKFDRWTKTEDSWEFREWFGKAAWTTIIPGIVLIVIVFGVFRIILDMRRWYKNNPPKK